MILRPIFIREEVIKSIREYFYKKHFHEVVIPVLNNSLPVEPNIYPFVTLWNAQKGKKKYYLSTSPESALKKMIARGIGNCFAIGKSFRNLEGSGREHIPEFLMLEWYRENASFHQIMDDVQELIPYVKNRIDDYLGRKRNGNLYFQGKTIKLKGEWPIFSMIDLYKNYAALDLREIIDDQKMKKAAAQKGYKAENASWEQLFNQIFLNEIEKKIGINPCFITDFPSRISPLCAIKKGDVRFAERFEVYLADMELGNGNTENTNMASIRKKFIAEKKKREKTGLISSPIDKIFLAALAKMKNKSYGGIGLGIDRLAMIMADVQDIKDIEPFADAFFKKSKMKS